VVRVNLIPENLQVSAARRRRARAWIVATGASLAVLALPALSDWLRRAEAGELAAAGDRLQSQLASLRKETVALAAQAAQARAHLERADALRAKRAWSALFALLAEQTPSGCWFTTIATEPASPPLAPQTRPPLPQPAPAASTSTHSSATASDSRTKPVVVIEAPRKLHLTGFATAAGEPHQLAANLKETGIFTNVVLEEARLEQTPEGAYFRFDLTCEW
jgi:Tfp pilus assembly protein PilN